jgi:hypothetical protein
MSGSGAQLYEEDFVRWTEQQSSALRDAAGVGTNLPLDWENLAEEVESLGRSQRHELRSRIAVIIDHLLKLERSPAGDPRPGWMDTIDRERDNIEVLLQDSPSLRGEVARIIAQECPRAARRAVRSLQRHGEDVAAAAILMARAGFTEQQVLGDWFRGDAALQPGTLPASGESEEPE